MFIESRYFGYIIILKKLSNLTVELSVLMPIFDTQIFTVFDSHSNKSLFYQACGCVEQQLPAEDAAVARLRHGD